MQQTQYRFEHLPYDGSLCCILSTSYELKKQKEFWLDFYPIFLLQCRGWHPIIPTQPLFKIGSQSLHWVVHIMTLGSGLWPLGLGSNKVDRRTTVGARFQICFPLIEKALPFQARKRICKSSRIVHLITKSLRTPNPTSQANGQCSKECDSDSSSALQRQQ